jgi:hypothetical protein
MEGRLLARRGPRAFNLNGLELLVFDDEILAFADLIASRNVLPRDDFAGLGIHVLLLQTVSGLPIDAIEADFSRSEEAG